MKCMDKWANEVYGVYAKDVVSREALRCSADREANRQKQKRQEASEASKIYFEKHK